MDWHSEIVQSGVTGELVENLDFVAMGEAAKKLLLDEHLLADLREAMLKLAHQVASPARITEEQIKIYSDLIQKSRNN